MKVWNTQKSESEGNETSLRPGVCLIRYSGRDVKEADPQMVCLAEITNVTDDTFRLRGRSGGLFVLSGCNSAGGSVGPGADLQRRRPWSPCERPTRRLFLVLSAKVRQTEPDN